jgi:hypothetical protein
MTFNKTTQKNLDRFEILETFGKLPDWSLVNTKIAAVVLGISESKLSHERLEENISDQVPFVNIGTRVKYRKSDIVEWLNNRGVNKNASIEVGSPGPNK